MSTATESVPNRRKKKLIVQKDFQFRFALQICLFGGTIFLVFAAFLMYVLRLNYETFLQEAIVQNPDMVDSLQREFRLLFLALIAGTLVLVGSLMMLGLVLSQKVSGPLFALKRRLLDHAQGHPKVRLSLRADDEFQDLQSAFNLAMEKNEDRLKSWAAKIQDVANSLSTAEERNKKALQLLAEELKSQ